MGRTTDTNYPSVFRVVWSGYNPMTEQTYKRYEGPYSTLAAARARTAWGSSNFVIEQLGDGANEWTEIE